MYSGLQEIRHDAALVAVHDSARPLLHPADAAACMIDAQEVCCMPCVSFASCLRSNACLWGSICKHELAVHILACNRGALHLSFAGT